MDKHSSTQATGSSPSDTTSYVYQLALLFKNGNAFTGSKGLNSNLNIYIEHSNEVWNNAFSQFGYVTAAAQSECGSNPSCNLNTPPPVSDPWGTTKQAYWTQRLHLRRTMEIGQIFSAVFGAGSLNTRIRPIYAHFTLPTFQYQNNLAWLNATFGVPNKFLWGVAQTKYYDDGDATNTATVDQVVNVLNASSYDTGNRANTIAINAIARAWGLQHTSYEGGAAVAAQNTVNLANRIMAHRSPRMRQVVASDFRDNWQALGGGIYNYFTVCGGYSRFGMWGLTDNLYNLTTPKYLGMQDVINSFPKTSTTTTAKGTTDASTATSGATSSNSGNGATTTSNSGGTTSNSGSTTSISGGTTSAKTTTTSSPPNTPSPTTTGTAKDSRGTTLLPAIGLMLVISAILAF